MTYYPYRSLSWEHISSLSDVSSYRLVSQRHIEALFYLSEMLRDNRVWRDAPNEPDLDDLVTSSQTALLTEVVVAGGPMSFGKINGTRASGENGGSASGSYAIDYRPLNTVVYPAAWLSLGDTDYELDLSAGTYRMHYTCSVVYTRTSRALIYDVTNDHHHYGNWVWLFETGNNTALLSVTAIVSNATPFTVRAGSQCQRAQSGTGHGVAANIGTEIYETLDIIKI